MLYNLRKDVDITDMSPKEKQLVVRLSESERNQLEAAAKTAGFLTVSEFVRYMTIGEGRSIQNDLKAILDKLDIKAKK